MEGADRLRRLRWLSRRGMKELDILLERFVDLNEQALAAGDWPQLESLLQTEDDVLWDWLQDTSAPDAAAFQAVLTKILDDGQ